MRLLSALSNVLFGVKPGGASLWGPDWTASAFAASPRGETAGVAVNSTNAGGLPALYRCCTFIADSLASIELRIVEEQPDGGKVVVEDTDASRALADWSYEAKEGFLYHAALGGNGIAVLRKNSRGGVTEIDTVMPRRVLYVLDDNNALFYSIYPELGPGSGENEVLAAQDVLHMRYRNIGDAMGRTFNGTPPIVSAVEAMGLMLASRYYQASLWEKGIIPVGVLKTPNTLKKEVIDRLRGQWHEFYMGGRATGKVAILEAGMEFQPMKPGVSASDSTLVDHNRFGVEEIARLYGIPPSVLAQTHNASYSTAVEEYRAAVLHCLRPWATRFTDSLSRALLTRDQRLKGLRVEAPLDHLLVAPGKETSEYLRDLVNSGILCTNEARNVLGYPDIAGGEVHRVPVNTTALENLPKIGLQQPKQDSAP